MKSLIERLDEYIEYAEKTKRFADVGFYKEVKTHIDALDQDSISKKMAVILINQAREEDRIKALNEAKEVLLRLYPSFNVVANSILLAIDELLKVGKDETLCLAQQVAEMEPDKRSIEDWSPGS